ncbi:N-octanoylanthranilate amidase (plasmid) [Rhodococcus erythropolis]|uniref:Probable N-octanoylanthranilate hydrolase AqdA2 n=1 Tax=Rhodococcus erythropolis TaxID=1833 RepID=AQDA2_RHOER|nr:carboxylesterase family protein [Rhodococcus erythropolis]A0A0E4AET8.1 RecName: Full=Probable N-octanoylanthranilate hydrolase AqdA2 [Rhodococcus erythropolis]AKE01140.1 N-octanoylanthranilate amidase [Rhodococcus erythropolis]
MFQTVTAPTGVWRGRVTGDVTVFHGIQYARADRFAPPQRCEPQLQHLVEVPEPGPIAPQSPSRLEGVMGAPSSLKQSEACLTVTVTTPHLAQPGSLPVLVWLHGGAFLSGSGAWEQYGAEQLVRETGIVVVSVNYRLGVLGYLCAPGISSGNLGLLDQITALEWVRDNIEAFGGDNGRVTLDGQSAGAHSIVAMLGIDRARSLFSRAIIQSAPLGLGFHSVEQARRAAEIFEEELGSDPRRAVVTDILAAQARTAHRLAGRGAMNSAPPFLPVHGMAPLPFVGEWNGKVAANAARRKILIGNTRDEMAAFFGPHPVFSAMRRVPLAGPQLAGAIQRRVQKVVFDNPVQEFADRFASAGASVWRYGIGPLHPDNPFGACHCIDIPLLFGDGDTWRDAPMLRPLSPKEIGESGTRTRRYWGEFVHTGRISDPAWPMHRPKSRYAHLLTDETIGGSA